MSENETFDGLFLWLTSFELKLLPKSAEDLTTGVAFSDVLSILDASFFNEDWRSRLQFDLDIGSNWRIKAANLKKVLKGILDYYNEVLFISSSVLPRLNLSQIAENADKHEINKMIQLVLGIAVNCPNNEKFIPKFTQFDPAVQQILMTAIQSLDKERTKSLNDSTHEDEYTKTLTDLREMKESRDIVAAKCEELQTQVSLLQDQNSQHRQDIDRLTSNLAAANSQDFDDPSTAVGRKLTQLQQRLEEVEEDLYKQEAAKEEWRIKCEKLEKDNRETNLRIEELKKIELNYQKIKDEVDELRMKANEAKKFETSLETYKKRLEEMGDLRTQVKTLEEKNTSLIRCSIDLEEEQKKVSSLRTQLESFKGIVKELNEDLSMQKQKTDKAEFDGQQAMDKLDAMTKVRDRLASELELLRERNEDTEFSQLLQAPNSGAETRRHNSDSQFVSVPLEIRENILRLEHENKQLKESLQSSVDEQVVLLQGRLGETVGMKDKMETDLRSAQRRIMELEAQQADSQSISSAKDTDQSDTDSRTGSRLYNMLKERNEKISQLEQKLEEKSSELQSQEARFKSCMEKALTVVQAAESRSMNTATRTDGDGLGSVSNADFEDLKRELSDKEKQLKKYLEEQDRMRIMKEQEERLVTTAFHNMALQLFRQSSDDRMSRSGGRSFLDRQREVVVRRPTASSSRSGSKSDELDDFAPSTTVT